MHMDIHPFTHWPDGTPRNNESRFAALPPDVQNALLGVVDAVADVSKAGDLKAAQSFIVEAQRLDNLPQSARVLLRSLNSVGSAVFIEEHSKRLVWARAEGFTGLDAFLAAIGHPDAGKPREDPADPDPSGESELTPT